MANDTHTQFLKLNADEIHIDGKTIDPNKIAWPSDWVGDIYKMHVHYKFHEPVENLDNANFKKLLGFRAAFIQEEVDELNEAIESNDAEEIVDALIDICVVAIGTLDLCKIDSHKAWQEVYKANMNKRVGINPSRPNPLGLPDLIKPSGWESPTHINNHGILTDKLKD